MRPYLALSAILLIVACDKSAKQRGDSLQTALGDQQKLSTQLQSQKDSLTRVVLDADEFIGQMDSAISTVKGLPRTKRKASDPLADQLQARKDMQDRVAALVARAKSTASQLVELQRKQAASQAENDELRSQLAAQTRKIEEDAQMIADLGATIERQKVEIETLTKRVDSLVTETRTLAERAYKAYYIVGTEKELLDKGVAVKEGRARFLFVRAGGTLVPARVFNPDVFTAIDQRQVHTIPVPDTTRRYRIVSRQSLDDTDTPWRDANSFKGNLKIIKPDQFWAPSKYLILLKQ